MAARAGPMAVNPSNSACLALAMPRGHVLSGTAGSAIRAFPEGEHGRRAPAAGHFRLALATVTGHSRERFRLTPVDGRITGEDEAILFGLRTTRSARRLHTL